MTRLGVWAIGLMVTACTRQNPFFVLAEEPAVGTSSGAEGGVDSDEGGAEPVTGGTMDDVCEGRGDADGDTVCDDEDRCDGGDDRVDDDADGTPNICDPCVRDPDDDLDHDGVCGDLDVCPDGDDALDGDHDGRADACDACPQDPGDDGDGDGVCDGVDQCPGADDGKDANGNGIPDACDECPDDADSDNDDVCDGKDKCPGFPDAQESDGDGVPDGCDKCPQDPGNDGDADGVCDDIDNCPGSFNPDQVDGDGDGRGDPCDVCQHAGYDDDNADYDGDGIACAQDPCLFDGPQAPGFPGAVGPFEEITISNAHIGGGGPSAVVAPGAPVALSYHWQLKFCECKQCLTQGMVGLADNPPNQCFYKPFNSLGNCNTHEGEAVQVFKAPAQPGMYFFRFHRTQEYKCVAEAKLILPATEFAAICVQ